ncbi:MAG: LUD domain-containing protein [Flavisolibacter sp.]|nr:LUD domain-containing protein [Flavisolibacter sp.]MBD0374017.1 LUD domain-containing protein [Flavisolibacter sp.]
MSSREKILAAVKKAQPDLLALPHREYLSVKTGDVQQFQTIVEALGAKAYTLKEEEEVIPYLEKLFPEAKRVVSAVTSIERYWINEHKNIPYHSLQDVDIAIIKAQFGVAENGALWVTEEDLKIRVLPFICEHLVAIVDAHAIVANMHEAYDRIGSADYGFGVFIAGPSKTADIEQSLVLGAHGPKSMTVFVRHPELP